MNRPSLPTYETPSVAVLCVVFLGSAPIALANFLLWTGIGNGWKNQLAPIGTSGLENLGFGRSVNNVITLPGNSYNSLTFVKDNQFEFTAATPSTLSLGAGGIDASYQFGTAIDFSSNLTVNLTAQKTAGVFAAGSYTAEVLVRCE